MPPALRNRCAGWTPGPPGCGRIHHNVARHVPACARCNKRHCVRACRHALRGLEDCFTLNPKAAKAQVFAGWKEMDQYMRENKLEGAPSVLSNLEKPPAAPAAPARRSEAETREGGAGRSRS